MYTMMSSGAMNENDNNNNYNYNNNITRNISIKKTEFDSIQDIFESSSGKS